MIWRKLKNKYKFYRNRVFPRVAPLRDTQKGFFLTEKDANSYEGLQLEPVRLLEIPLEKLHCAISVDFAEVQKPFFLRNGKLNTQIIYSPHFRLLETYQKEGRSFIEKNLFDLDYPKFVQTFNKVGFSTDYRNPSRQIPLRYSKEFIRKKVLSLIDLYERIKKLGYLGGHHQGQYISVLEKPFAITRFQKTWDGPVGPYEIFVGHHRAAVLASLGKRSISCVLLEDQGSPVRLDSKQPDASL